MKIKVQQIMDATLVISQIIRDQRPMPTKGRYRLARMHAKLMPEFLTINAQRDDLIKVYDYHQKISMPSKDDPLGQSLVDGPEFTVPEDKMPEYLEAWKKIAEEVIEIDIQPIPLEQLDLGDNVDGTISAHEFAILGDLVIDAFAPMSLLPVHH